MRYQPFQLPDIVKEYNESASYISEFKSLINQDTFRFQSGLLGDHVDFFLSKGILVNDGTVVQDTDVFLGEHPIVFYGLLCKSGLGTVYGFETDLEVSFKILQSFIERYRKIEGVLGFHVLLKLPGFLIVCCKQYGLNDPATIVTSKKTSPDLKNAIFSAYLNNIETWSHTYFEYWSIAKEFILFNFDPNSQRISVNWNELVNPTESILGMSLNTSEILKFVKPQIGSEHLNPLINITLIWLRNNDILSDMDVLELMGNDVSFDSALVIVMNHLPDTLEMSAEIWTFIQSKEVSAGQLNLIFVIAARYLNDITDLPVTTRNSILQFFQKHASDGNVANISKLISSLLYCQRESQLAFDVFIMLHDRSDFNHVWIGDISHYYSESKNMEGFFGFLERYALEEKHPFNKVYFNVALQSFARSDLKQYISGVTRLLIHDWGQVRKIGGKLLFDLVHETDIASLELDVDALDYLKQYKFVVSSTAHPMFARELAIVLTPFLKSSSSVVRELCLSKMEKAAYDYGLQFVRALTIISKLPDDDQLVTHLKEVATAADEMFQKIDRISEFNPQIAFPNELRLFYKHYTLKNTELLAKARSEHNGISRLFKTVNVHRGGGFVTPGGRIMPLSTISSSFSIPRSMYRDLLKVEAETYQFYITNWEADVAIWKKKLFS